MDAPTMRWFFPIEDKNSPAIHVTFPAIVLVLPVEPPLVPPVMVRESVELTPVLPPSAADSNVPLVAPAGPGMGAWLVPALLLSRCGTEEFEQAGSHSEAKPSNPSRPFDRAIAMRKFTALPLRAILNRRGTRYRG